jgi:hypothetical protein
MAIWKESGVALQILEIPELHKISIVILVFSIIHKTKGLSWVCRQLRRLVGGEEK